MDTYAHRVKSVRTSLSSDLFHNCACLAGNLDWRIHTKSESGDQAWFVNNDNIVNIDTFRISLIIIPNIVSTKLGYQ